MIRAAIFDLDGTIINSEPLWKLAEQKVFETVGLKLNDEMCGQTTGLPLIETVEFWYRQKPWNYKPVQQLAEEILEEVIRLIAERVELKDAVTDVIDMYKQNNIPVAVASSSPFVLINAALEKFGLKEKFDIVHSSEKEKFGKPHPAVYIKTAELLNVKPVHCIAFEDSFNGTLSAKSARCRVVALLEEGQYNNSKYDFVDLKIESFRNFGKKEFEYFNTLSK